MNYGLLINQLICYHPAFTLLCHISKDKVLHNIKLYTQKSKGLTFKALSIILFDGVSTNNPLA